MRFREFGDGPVPEGRGEVRPAHDELMGRPVVLKRSDRGEARAAAKFSHPHVVVVHEILENQETDQRPLRGTWLVMEYVPNGSLRGRTFPPREAARIGAQIADALTALHDRRLVHCDVKPANILDAGEGRVKLGDFDAAYRLDQSETITTERSLSYTRDFAAPELADGDPRPASDVFSLGATLYALVTGIPPRPWTHEPGWSGAPRNLDEEARIRRGVRQGTIRTDRDIGPLREAVTAMLRRRPEQRPSAEEARAMLRAVAEPAQAPLAQATTASTGSSATPPPPRPRHWPRRRWALAALVAAGAVAAAVTGFGASRDSADPRPLIADRREADPCALHDPRALARFGDIHLDNAYGNFDRCDVLVNHDGPASVDVEIVFDDGPFGQGDVPSRHVGEIGIVELEQDADGCERGLTLPAETDDTIVVVVAKYEDDRDGRPGPMPLCEMADVIAEHAAAELEQLRAAGEQVPERSFAADSLARLDACTVVPGDALADVIPAVDLADPDPGYGNWTCSWSSTSDDLVATARFDQGDVLTADAGDPTLVEGRDAFVTPEAEGHGSCGVAVEHRTFTGRGGIAKAEMLKVAVIGDAPTDRLCPMATDLATAATAQLPAA